MKPRTVYEKAVQDFTETARQLARLNQHFRQASFAEFEMLMGVDDGVLKRYGLPKPIPRAKSKTNRSMGARAPVALPRRPSPLICRRLILVASLAQSHGDPYINVLLGISADRRGRNGNDDPARPR